jgi:predicted Fe-Mo cluster-binding NifX family protein
LAKIGRFEIGSGKDKKMRIAVTSQGQDLEGEVEQRFGRAPWFLIVDTETLKFEAIENTQSTSLPQGAGIQAAQNVANSKPEAVLTGNCGPKAFKVLQAAGIQICIGVRGRIKEAIQAYVNGEYNAADQANVEGHWM